jgi:hypothetical protein
MENNIIQASGYIFKIEYFKPKKKMNKLIAM